MKKVKAKDQVRTLTVTQRDYEKEIAAGTPPEDALKPGRYQFRRSTRFARPEDLPRTPKVVVTMRLDRDVLEFFKSDVQGETGYQTRINAELRKIMEASQSKEGGAIPVLRQAQGLIETAVKSLARRS